MKKIFLLIPIVIYCLFLLFPNSSNSDKYFEEAFPIFENDKINGLVYDITINKNTNDSKLIIYPKIFNSIYHFKDINSIDIFNINIRIKNNSNSKYIIKSINYFDRKTFNYNDTISNSINNNYFYSIDRSSLLNRNSDLVEIIFEKK